MVAPTVESPNISQFFVNQLACNLLTAMASSNCSSRVNVLTRRRYVSSCIHSPKNLGLCLVINASLEVAQVDQFHHHRELYLYLAHFKIGSFGWGKCGFDSIKHTHSHIQIMATSILRTPPLSSYYVLPLLLISTTAFHGFITPGHPKCYPFLPSINGNSNDSNAKRNLLCRCISSIGGGGDNGKGIHLLKFSQPLR